MYPEAGITKGDVLDFYRRIAKQLLPYLHDRPATLERLPEGLEGPDAPHFWQKRTPDYYPAWIERVELPSEHGEPVPYVLVNDEETLLYLVNQGTLTFHVGFSRLADLDRPDMVLFDIDPGRASFADVMAVAKNLHRVLQSAGHQAFVKTSGKTGLHVLVPWQEETDYNEARAWALAPGPAGGGHAPGPRHHGAQQSQARQAGIYRCDAERQGPPCRATLCTASRAGRPGLDAITLAGADVEARPQSIQPQNNFSALGAAAARPHGRTPACPRNIAIHLAAAAALLPCTMIHTLPLRGTVHGVPLPTDSTFLV